MQKSHSNKFNAYQGLRGVLFEHKDVYENVPLVNELVEEFLKNLEEIQQISGRILYGTKEYTKNKNKVKGIMARKASALAAAGAVYAIDREDMESLGALKWSYSRIRFAKDSEALFRAWGIENTLRNKLPELGRYMVSKKDLDDLAEEIEQYESIIERRGSEKAEIVSARAHLRVLFSDTGALLKKKLDRMMKRIGEENADFYRLYRQARKINDHK